MSTDQELRCVISDLMDQVRDRDAEIARLTAERDTALDHVRQMIEKAADEKLDGYRELGARAANAENERDAALAKLKAREKHCSDKCFGYPTEGVRHWVAAEALDTAIARAEKAERVARDVYDIVTQSRAVVGFHLNGDEAPWDEFECIGELSALVEACEGGRDGE